MIAFRLLRYLLLISGISFVHAQDQLGFNYQAQVRDANGAPLANQAVNARVRILQGNATGTVVFQEVHNPRSNADGYIQLIIGNGTNERGSLLDVNWQGATHFLQLEINGADAGTQRLEAVPYSKVATQMKIAGLTDVSANVPNEGQALIWDGANWTPKDVEGGNSTGASVWTKQGNDIFYNDGEVNVGENLTVSKDIRAIGLEVELVAEVGELSVNGDAEVFGFIFAEGGVVLGQPTGVGTSWRADYFLDSGTGIFETYGSGNGNIPNVSMNHLNGFPNNGYLSIYDAQGVERGGIYANEVNTGHAVTRGPNGDVNLNLSYLVDNPNHGYIEVADANGIGQVSMFVDANGFGTIIASGAKSFVSKHPLQPGKEIWYAAVEGPEAAAFVRGTGQLVNGRARIDFPEHFEVLINANSLTIVLTPLSPASKGMAVFNKSVSGFEVQELFEGTGTYEFDWEAKAVRKGFENFQVVRDEGASRAGVSSRGSRKGAEKP